ncbi:MAG: hypothetical protein M3128_11795 [Verrucomicrobiota bacterium]|nr:hypothetical protein [Verrucomicrobiota bacterium]
MIKIATSLLALSLLAACQSTSATAQRQSAPRQNMQQRMLAQSAPTAEPAPPAEGPEDVPATRTVDPNRNPGLLPTPLLRGNAAGSL